nr:hypothetical protein [candidate division Zixibacteria bacterium]
MSRKLNCWEFRNCGLEPGGVLTGIYGTCKVAQVMKLDGINGGRGAGRACWMVNHSGSHEDHPICRNSRQSCYLCEFYLRVENEENHKIDERTIEKPVRIY